MRNHRSSLRRFLCLGVLAALLSGCADIGMKGTPFYTGEYARRQGPVEDRVNLWPLVYYRKPALSVLWPFVELTDEHFAVRPLMSVYGLDQERHQYNVLWPLSQFDRQSADNRIFPFFWGDDYRVGFPLYWHFGHPLGEKGGYDGLIPLWSYRKDASGYSAFFPWPLIHWQDYGGEKGWHVWPLAGSYESRASKYKFLLWPLMHYSFDGTTELNMVLPLWLYSRDQGGSLFISLPWSSASRNTGEFWQLVPPVFYRSGGPEGSFVLSLLYSGGSKTADNSSWKLLLPLFYNRTSPDSRFFATLLGGFSRDDDGLGWLALPALSGGTKSADHKEVWLVGPLAHGRWDKDSSSQHVLPLFYRSSSPTDHLFVSLPWSSRNGTDGKSWQLIPPLYFHRADPDGEFMATPVFAHGASADRRQSWNTVIPLYYSSRDNDQRVFATLAGGYRTDAHGEHWLVYPLLSWGSHEGDAGSFWAVAPLIHAAWSNDRVSHQVLPLYYWNADNSTFASLPYARWHGDGDRTTTLVPPLLSWMNGTDKSKALWMAGGLARYGWGEEPGPRYVIPLFYRNPKTGSTASPLFASWRRASGSDTKVVPWLLSWLTKSDQRSDLWALGPLAHFSWGEKPGSEHVVPFFYRNPAKGSFFSLAFATWTNSESRTRMYPLLLSQYSTATNGGKDVWGVLGLFHRKWGGAGEQGEGHLLPLYTYHGDREFYTPLFGWDKDPLEGFMYPLTPLFGVRTGERTGAWLFPLFTQTRQKKNGDVNGWFLWGRYWSDNTSSGSHLFPLYTYRDDRPLSDAESTNTFFQHTSGKDFLCLPFCWYQNQSTVKRQHGTSSLETVRKNGFFPLWSYEKFTEPAKGSTNAGGTVLIRLYDYHREVRPKSDRSDAVDYTRTRVLWHLWHYERSNGDVSVDVFPAITYDRKTDGFKKITFLWRAFRYEREAGGARKLDLLFLPILRTKGA